MLSELDHLAKVKWLGHLKYLKRKENTGKCEKVA